MFGHSWEMLKQSYAVLKKQKTLVLFPIFSMIACILVTLSFLLPILLMPDFLGKMAKGAQDLQAGGGAGKQILWFVIAFLFYFVNYFVIIFFNVALTACAIVHFRGGEPTFGAGLSAAGKRLPQITAWALVSATVGMILRAIEERAEWVGKIVSGLLGVVWTIATYLVIPVLAVEKVGPFDAIKRSGKLLKKAWGEGLVGGFSIGLIGFLLTIPGLILAIGGAALIGGQNLALGILCVAIGVLYLIAVSIVMSTLRQIYISGLYLYAVDGQSPQGFSNDVIQAAFKQKKRK